MRLENFTTARCSKCGWLKQFQPGKDYDYKEFKCDCNQKPKPKTLKEIADNLGIDYAHNISDKTLAKRIEEAQNV